MVRERPPHRALAGFVDRFWMRTPSGAPRGERVLPDGCIDVLVHLAPAPRVVVVGTMTRAYVPPANGARIAAVRFRPGGATPFLRVPAAELTDKHVAAADLGLGWLEQTPLDAREPDEAARLLEEILLARLGATRSPSPQLAHAARRLWEGDCSVGALAREIGWSRQHLARVFRHEIGVGPKELARVTRMQRALARIRADGDASLAAIAADLGYFDQAHMARDFRALVGLPAQAIRRDGSIFPIRSPFDAP